MPKEYTHNTQWERKLDLLKPIKAATQEYKPMTDTLESLQQNTLEDKWLHRRIKAMFGATS